MELKEEKYFKDTICKIKKSVDRILNLMERESHTEYMVTVKEAARLVGVSYATILKMIHRGLLPAEKGPRAYRISYADVVRQFGVKKNIPV